MQSLDFLDVRLCSKIKIPPEKIANVGKLGETFWLAYLPHCLYFYMDFYF